MSADALRALHVPGDPLVLPNVWDAATAKVVVEAGFPAVATTSSGVAEALGYEDGERTPARRDARRGAGASPARSTSRSPPTSRPATAWTAGRSPTASWSPAPSASTWRTPTTPTARARSPSAEQMARIAGSRRPPTSCVNARIDVHIRGGDTDAALLRARCYRDAGADCLYPIGITDEATIAGSSRSARR